MSLQLDIGTYGQIRTRPVGDRWQAIAQYRDSDGYTRQYARTGSSKSTAVRALRNHLTKKSATTRSGTIRSGTRMPDLAMEYFDRLERLVEAGDRSPNTLRLYRGHWDNHGQIAFGGLTVAEVDIQCVDRFLIELRRRHNANLVKTVRAVLSGMLGLAARYGAIPANPVRDASAIPGDGARPVRALQPSEAVDLWRKLLTLAAMPGKFTNARTYRSTLIDPDLPDLVLWMLGTAQRIGQALAVHWPWIDLETATAALGPNVIRVKGEGLRLNQGTSKTKEQVLDLPSGLVTMLLTRSEAAVNPAGPVFPDVFGGLRDPNNTSGDLRRALDLAGYEWVTSHVFRKTVATVLDDAGLSARHVADQLAHARPSMTQDRYMARRARNPRAKAAIEAMLSTDTQ